jgi:hypothetical protein
MSRARAKKKDAQVGARQAKASQADLLLELARDQTYFTARDGQTYAAVVDGPGRPAQTLAVRGAGFSLWLCRRYYEATRGAPSRGAVEAVINTLDARARFAGQPRDVYTRVGRADDGLYVDLCDEAWQAVRIRPGGWEVIARPPIHFRRPHGMMPLPAPQLGAGLTALRHYVNVAEEDWPLLVAWLVQVFGFPGPYPLLWLLGEQGSAKSTTGRVLRSLTDPNIAPLRAEPRNEQDLILSAHNSWVIVLDNLSHVSPQLSDALCRLSTGGGFSTRQLFKDTDEIIIDVQRPVLVTGIEELATRDDLLDRSIVLELPTIRDTGRRTEQELWRAFEADRPKLLGAILDAVAAMLAELPNVRLASPPRMADFARRGTALGVAQGWGECVFLDAYERNRANATGSVLEASVIYQPLLAVLRRRADGQWSGTCHRLLEELTLEAGEKLTRGRGWPATPRALGGRLRRLAPALRKSGITVTFAREGGDERQRLVTITATAPLRSFARADELD